MRSRQRGITFIGWLFLLIPMALVVYSAIRLVPVYLNYSRIARAMEQLGQEGRASDSARGLRFALEKRLDIESVTFPESKDFVIRRDGQSWLVEIEYEDGAPLLANLSIDARFIKSVRIGQEPE